MVRNGFVLHTRRELPKLRGLRIDFVSLPDEKTTMYSLTKEEMKKCIWLKPELVARSNSPNGPPAVTCPIQSR
jgi:hypothetical protein